MGSLLSRETEASPGGVDHSTVRLSGTVAPLANGGSITTTSFFPEMYLEESDERSVSRSASELALTQFFRLTYAPSLP